MTTTSPPITTSTTTTVPPTTVPLTTTTSTPPLVPINDECVPCYPDIPSTNTPPPIPSPTTLKGDELFISRNEPDNIIILIDYSSTTPNNTLVTSTTIQVLPTTNINISINNVCITECQTLKF